MTTPKKFVGIPLVLLVLALNLAFGLPRLSSFSAVDEPYWTYDRISQFWTAVAKQKWRSTNINDKPGITVAILAGPGLAVIDPMPYKNIRDEAKDWSIVNTIQRINFSLRLPIFLFCALSLLAFYFLLRKLFDERIALFSTIFIGLSPIILGMSLLINPDALLWVFLPLSTLAYLIFRQEENKKYLYLSGFLLGLSLLTKYVANILYIYFVVLIFLEYLFNAKEQATPIVQYLKKSFLNYGILVLISMVTFFVLFPATWKSPHLLLDGTFLSKAFKTTWPLFIALIVLILADTLALKGRVTASIIAFLNKYKDLLLRAVSLFLLAAILFVLADTYLGMQPYDFENILASPKGESGSSLVPAIFAGNIFADIYSLIFGLTPIVFIFFIIALIKNAWTKQDFSQEKLTVFYFSLFILFYYAASTINHVGATVRYQIILYPLASIIAAIGLTQFLRWEKIQRYTTKINFYFLPLALILISAFSLYLVRPYFFAYASALLPQKYLVNFKDMGDGSYEAAQYLNSLPNAHELVVWSDKGAVCESFLGKCNTGLTMKDISGKHFDYFVVSSGRKSRTTKMAIAVDKFINFKGAYTTDKFAKQFILGNRINNYVKIIPGDVLYKQ